MYFLACSSVTTIRNKSSSLSIYSIAFFCCSKIPCKTGAIFSFNSSTEDSKDVSSFISSSLGIEFTSARYSPPPLYASPAASEPKKLPNLGVSSSFISPTISKKRSILACCIVSSPTSSIALDTSSFMLDKSKSSATLANSFKESI